MSTGEDPGGSQVIGERVNKRKDKHQLINNPNDEDLEIRLDDSGGDFDDAILELRHELIETLARHNSLLDGKQPSAAAKKTMIEDNNKLINKLKAAEPNKRPKMNQNEVSAQLKSLAREMKTMQDDLKQVKKCVKQNGPTNRDAPAAQVNPSVEDRLVIIEPGKKSYSEITNTLKKCKLVEDKLRVDSLYTTKNKLMVAKMRSVTGWSRIVNRPD